VFNVFGYEHLVGRVFAFLKYIPAELQVLFDVEYLEKTWTLEGQKLIRAEKLYTAQNYQAFLQTFEKKFPYYAYYCPFRKKLIVSAPLDRIRRIFVPRECLHKLGQLGAKDDLQRTTLSLVDMLSNESGINPADFGVHGSVALNMHTSKSDIDLVVYGAHNFRLLETAINRLVEQGKLSYKFSNRLDATRRCKGTYLKKIFMYNAVRKPEEIKQKYGEFKYTTVAPVSFTSRVEDDSEAMFRPAIYKISHIKTAENSWPPRENNVPKIVISMIGCYRNVARRGDSISVAGTLERVESLETGHIFHQVVVGTALNEEEHIWPLKG